MWIVILLQRRHSTWRLSGSFTEFWFTNSSKSYSPKIVFIRSFGSSWLQFMLCRSIVTISLFMNKQTVLSFARFVANITRISSAIVMNLKVLFHISNIYCNFAAEQTLDIFRTRNLGSILAYKLIKIQLPWIRHSFKSTIFFNYLWSLNRKSVFFCGRKKNRKNQIQETLEGLCLVRMAVTKHCL